MSTQKSKLTFVSQPWNISMIVAANVFALVVFVQSDGNVMQVIWIYLVQTMLAACFYYRRIKKIPLLELDYAKNHSLKKAKVFEQIVQSKIKTERFFFPLIVLPVLIACTAFVAQLSNGKPVELYLNGEHIVGHALTTPSLWPIAVGGGLFFMHSLIGYWLDCKRAERGIKIENRYSMGIRAFAGIAPLFCAILFGPIAFVYLGSGAFFVVFMIAKTGLEIVLSTKGVSA